MDEILRTVTDAQLARGLQRELNRKDCSSKFGCSVLVNASNGNLADLSGEEWIKLRDVSIAVEEMMDFLNASMVPASEENCTGRQDDLGEGSSSSRVFTIAR